MYLSKSWSDQFMLLTEHEEKYTLIHTYTLFIPKALIRNYENDLSPTIEKKMEQKQYQELHTKSDKEGKKLERKSILIWKTAHKRNSDDSAWCSCVEFMGGPCSLKNSLFSITVIFMVYSLVDGHNNIENHHNWGKIPTKAIHYHVCPAVIGQNT